MKMVNRMITKAERDFYRFVRQNSLSIIVILVLVIWILFLIWRISILGR